MNTKIHVNQVAIWFVITSFLVIKTDLLRAQHTQPSYKAVNRTITVDKSSNIIRLDRNNSVGIAWILKQDFTAGTIEFDVKGNDEYQGSFVGIAFHGADDQTYEAVYFRPFKFRAKDSLRNAHAVQYISNPAFDWPLLRERFPGKYERQMPADIDPNNWFHVKIVVLQHSVRAYINGNTIPVMDVQPLTEGRGKMLGYWVGNGSGGEWKNLSIKKSSL
jgi:hypothetical protein